MRVQKADIFRVFGSRKGALEGSKWRNRRGGESGKEVR